MLGSRLGVQGAGMLNQEIYYECEPASCFAKIRDEAIPATSLVLASRIGPVPTGKYTYRLRLTDEDFDGLTLRARLYAPLQARLPEFRIYCKAAGDGCLVLVRRLSKDLFGSKIMQGYISTTMKVGRTAYNVIPGGKSVLRNTKYEIDGKQVTDASVPDYLDRLADGLMRAAVTSLHHQLSRALARG